MRSFRLLSRSSKGHWFGSKSLMIKPLNFFIYLLVNVDVTDGIGAFILGLFIRWDNPLSFFLRAQSISNRWSVLELAGKNSLLCVWIHIWRVGGAVGLLSKLWRILSFTHFLLRFIFKYFLAQAAIGTIANAKWTAWYVKYKCIVSVHIENDKSDLSEFEWLSKK